jgi:hypothetical protein
VTATELEAVLREAYEMQVARYQQALTQAESLGANWKQGDDIAVALQPILAIMDEIATRNVAIESHRQQWLQGRHAPSPPLEAVLRAMAELIERLAVRIRELELLATACKNQLAPQLDNLHRGRQMQRAYAGAAFRRRAANG